MTNTIAIIFQNYQTNSSYSDILYRLFENNINRYLNIFDKIILIDNGNIGISCDHSDVTVICNDVLLHQNNIDTAFKTCNTDNLLLLDNDVIIYDYSIFEEILINLETNDIVTTLDTGSRNISEQHIPDSSIFSQNENRGCRNRIAPYMCGMNRNIYYQNDHPLILGDAEAMENFTANILESNLKIKELPDYRNSIYYRLESDESYISQFGDDDNCTMERFKLCKYYHIRNFGDSISTIYDFINGNGFDNRQLKCNPSEGIRILAWLYCISEKLHYPLNDINDVISHLNMLRWDNYILEFKKFHKIYDF